MCTSFKLNAYYMYCFPFEQVTGLQVGNCSIHKSLLSN